MPRPTNPKPPYPQAFRQQMIELVLAGRKPSELAKQFGCIEPSISAWVRQAGGMPTPVQAVALSSDERRELVELRRKLRQVQQERDILANPLCHTAAWFAVKSEKTSTACFAPVDKPPHVSANGTSACPQASPVDKPALLAHNQSETENLKLSMETG